MMQMQVALYSWAMTIACAGVLTALFEILLPSGGLKRFGRVGLGLVMTLAMAQPLVQWILQWS